MQRERLKTAAASRDSLVGVAVGSSVGRAVASEENCARFNESQGVDKEPVPLTTGLTHEYPWPPPCTHRMQAYQLSNTAASAVRNGAVVSRAPSGRRRTGRRQNSAAAGGGSSGRGGGGGQGESTGGERTAAARDAWARAASAAQEARPGTVAGVRGSGDGQAAFAISTPRGVLARKTSR